MTFELQRVIDDFADRNLRTQTTDQAAKLTYFLRLFGKKSLSRLSSFAAIQFDQKKKPTAVLSSPLKKAVPR